MRGILRSRPSPAMVVALIALVLAGTGGAIAATGQSTAKVKRRHADRAQDVKTIRSFFNANHAKLVGHGGPKGSKGDKGDKGDAGATGATGPAGPLLDTLPSGKTLHGTFYVSGTGGTDFAQGVTFQFALGAAPTPHFVSQGAAAPAQCPGTATSPQAQAGNLCVYESSHSASATNPRIWDPAGNVNGQASKWGFAVVVGTNNGAVTTFSLGTWAVTAP